MQHVRAQGIEAAAKTPTVNEWNLTIEQQVGSNMAFRVGYVGSFGYHVAQHRSQYHSGADLLEPAGCAVDTGTTEFRKAPSTFRCSQHLRRRRVRRVRILTWRGVLLVTGGNSSYNALQLEVIRRLSQGLQFRGNYTWAKNLDMNSALTIAQAQNQPQMVMDRTDLRRDWGPSALTPTQPGEHFRALRTALRHGNAKGLRNLISRLATERDHVTC